MTREVSKKNWEKERRDRLKDAFTNLEKLLPNYDPSSASTKINVIIKSIEYIQEMQNKIQELLKAKTKINAEVLQLKKLQDRIKKLVTRTELLSSLLREAKIPIPHQGSTLKNFKYVHKWSGRINEKTALVLQKKTERTKENEKENKKLTGAESTNPSKPKSKQQRNMRNKLNSSSLIPKHRKNITDRSNTGKGLRNGTLAKRKSLQTVTTNCLIIYTQACNTQPCYLVTNAPSNNFGSSSQTVITNSLVASNPLMSTNVKVSRNPLVGATPKLPSLGAGTLILANGTLYPVLPQSQPIIPAPMVLQVANNSNAMVIKSGPKEYQKSISDAANISKLPIRTSFKNVTSSSTCTPSIFSNTVVTKVSPIVSEVSADVLKNNEISSHNKLPQKEESYSKNIAIRPKRCLTRTTQVNKVPIPALTSNYSACILNSPIPGPVPNKKRLGRKIGNTPMSRKALRAIRKMAQQKKNEQENEDAKRIQSSVTIEQTSITEANISANGKIVEPEIDIPKSVDPEKNNCTQQSDQPEILPKTSKTSLNNDNANTISLSQIQLGNQAQSLTIIPNDIIRGNDSSKVSTSMDLNIDESITSTNIKQASITISNYFTDTPHENSLIEKEEKLISENSDSKKKIEVSTSSLQFLNADLNNQSLSRMDQTGDDQLSIRGSQLTSSEIIPIISSDNIEQSHCHHRNENINELNNTNDVKNASQNLIEGKKYVGDNNQPSGNHVETENLCNMNHHIKSLDLHLSHSELSNDIFASLQVPAGCQNPESTSPTAAFLLAFPLVSSGVKVTEVMDDDNADSQRETPTLLQIGTMDTTKPTQSDSLTPNLLNLDNLSFFSSKDIYSGFYNTFEQHLNSLTASTACNFANDFSKITDRPNIPTNNSKSDKINSGQSSDLLSLQGSIKNKSDLQSNSVKNKNISSNDNNKNIISSDFNTQPNFSLHKKSANPTVKNVDGNVKISQAKSVDIYNQKSSSHVQNTTVQSDSMNVIHSLSTNNKSTEKTQRSMNQAPFNTNRTIQKKGEHSKCFSSQIEAPLQRSNFESNTFNDFIIKRTTTESSNIRGPANDNVFSTDNRESITSKVQKGLEQSNMSFSAEKQNLPLLKNLEPQISSRDNMNVQPVFQKNIQTSQLPFVENRNFIPIASQSNFSHSLFSMDNNNTTFAQKNTNYKNLTNTSDNRHICSLQKNINQPYFNSDNKEFQKVPVQKDAASTKNIHNDNMSNLPLQKNAIFSHFDVGSKNIIPSSTQKGTDTNFIFNLNNKAVPVTQKTESKQIPPSYNVTYSNINYDLNTISKVCTCAYTSNKTFSEPLYTNSNTNNYSYYSNSENYVNESCYKNTKNDKNLCAVDFENFDYRKTDFSNTYYTDNNSHKNTIGSNKTDASVQEKPTYNWMTTPTKSSTDHILPTFTKDDSILYSAPNIISNNQTTYFNTAPMYTGETSTNLGQTTKKNFELPLMNSNTNFQKNEMEENQFTWSPTKMPQFLDPVPSFVSSTLPTLVGDLALGTSNFTDQKLEMANRCNNNKDVKNKTIPKFNYENQNNFFSVSQLVHQNKDITPVKTTRRRNSGSGSKSTQSKNRKVAKSSEEQKDVQCMNKSPGSHVKNDNKNLNCRQPSNNLFYDSNKVNSVKVSSTNYSAEALIGHQGQSDFNSKRDQLYSGGGTVKNIPVPPYIPDNIIPYFPPVDLPQDNNYIQQNQNYQNFTHNFTTFSNNNYSTNTFIPSSTMTTPYLSTTTFMTDLGSGHEFTPDNMNLFTNPGTQKDKFKNTIKNNSNGRDDKNVQSIQCPTNPAKKMKRKSSNENNITPNFVDFSFLSVPGSINSPLLPDDFHSHASFLPPPPTQPQLYPCKNTLYPPKQNTITSSAPLLPPLPPLPTVTKAGIQHPEISPSLNSVGTSLTNFNLSTIFPEINKGSMNEIYPDNRVKEAVTRHYPNSSISFDSKPIFSYPNCQTTQAYNIDNR